MKESIKKLKQFVESKLGKEAGINILDKVETGYECGKLLQKLGFLLQSVQEARTKHNGKNFDIRQYTLGTHMQAAQERAKYGIEGLSIKVECLKNHDETMIDMSITCFNTQFMYVVDYSVGNIHIKGYKINKDTANTEMWDFLIYDRNKNSHLLSKKRKANLHAFLKCLFKAIKEHVEEREMLAWDPNIMDEWDTIRPELRMLFKKFKRPQTIQEYALMLYMTYSLHTYMLGFDDIRVSDSLNPDVYEAWKMSWSNF